MASGKVRPAQCGIDIQLHSYGNETSEVPVLVEILDSALQAREQVWMTAKQNRYFDLEPGIYAVRASLASGAVIEKTCELREESTLTCELPLHSASPHESNEWAYFTQAIDSPGKHKLTHRRYRGAWIRLWEKTEDSPWRIVSFPAVAAAYPTWAPDGVTYSFRTHEKRQYAIQVGGPNIPWKCTAVPAGCGVGVLVRPAAAPAGRTHPLDVIVSTENVEAASLLAFMQRGDMARATAWTNYWGDNNLTAERLLNRKRWDPPAAAVGGYYLLRVRDFDRLHDWAENLANWFSWMPDGAIIRACQMIADLRGRQDRTTADLRAACGRFLEAIKRGVPLYTEGLWLLRDGLRLFETLFENVAVETAIKVVNAYVESSDPAVAATTFTAERPDRPSGSSRKGTPESNGEPFAYVYDVPLRAVLQQGLVPVDATIVTAGPPYLKVRLGTNGILTLGDGRSFATLGQMANAFGDKSLAEFDSWIVDRDKRSLSEISRPLRELPMGS